MNRVVARREPTDRARVRASPAAERRRTTTSARSRAAACDTSLCLERSLSAGMRTTTTTCGESHQSVYLLQRKEMGLVTDRQVRKLMTLLHLEQTRRSIRGGGTTAQPPDKFLRLVSTVTRTLEPFDRTGTVWSQCGAGWSSPVVRRAHNRKVGGSTPPQSIFCSQWRDDRRYSRAGRGTAPPGGCQGRGDDQDLGGSAAYWVVLVCTDYVEKAETGGAR